MENAGEKPLAILRPNRKACTIGEIIILGCLLYSIFGIVLPVLMTGDYSAMWISSDEEIEYRVIIFYASLIFIPLALFNIMLILHSTGTYYFYENRMELHTHWIKRKIVMPYNEMHVLYLNMGLRITREKIPDWSHPLKRFKIKYWDGVGFGTNFNETKILGMKTGETKTWMNPEDGPEILNILNEKVSLLKNNNLQPGR